MEIDGCAAYWVDATNGTAKRAAVMLHGGGHWIGSAKGYQAHAAYVSYATNSRVLVPEYPLAPEHPSGAPPATAKSAPAKPAAAKPAAAKPAAAAKKPADAKSAAAPKPAAKAAAPKAATPKPAAPKPAAAKKAVPASAKAAAGKPDNLRRLIGIGPVNEKLLKGLGVTSYAQIAAWTAADVKRIEDVLNFDGRIAREQWIDQAKLLAAGDEKEFARRFPTAGTTNNT